MAAAVGTVTLCGRCPDLFQSVGPCNTNQCCFSLVAENYKLLDIPVDVLAGGSDGVIPPAAVMHHVRVSAQFASHSWAVACCSLHACIALCHSEYAAVAKVAVGIADQRCPLMPCQVAERRPTPAPLFVVQHLRAAGVPCSFRILPYGHMDLVLAVKDDIRLYVLSKLRNPLP